MPKVPQTVWGLLRNYWPLKFFIPAFSNVWNRPIFHDVAKPVQIGTCQPTMIFVSSQKEYKREKVYCSVQTTQTQGWWPLAPVFLHSKAGLFLLFHVSSDENMDSPCGLLVLQIFPYEERESVYLTSIQCKAVQTVAGTIKASGARSVHQKGSLWGSWCTPKPVQRVRTLVRSSGSRCNRVLPVWWQLVDVLDLVRTLPTSRQLNVNHTGWLCWSSERCLRFLRIWESGSHLENKLNAAGSNLCRNSLWGLGGEVEVSVNKHILQSSYFLVLK